MIVRTLDEVAGSDRDVAGDGWRSRRLLLRRDGMGFSLHDTTVEVGQQELEYKHHFEACYCVEGEAEITVSGKPLRTTAGDAVLMPANQPHSLKALSRFKMLLTMIRS